MKNSRKKKYSVLIIGFGAVGKYIAAQAKIEGHHVTVWTSPASEKKNSYSKVILEHAVTENKQSYLNAFQVEVETNSREDRKYDIVIFAVKSFSLDSAVRYLNENFLGNEHVVFLQSSFDLARAAKMLKANTCFGAMVMFGVSAEKNGRVVRRVSDGFFELFKMKGIGDDKVFSFLNSLLPTRFSSSSSAGICKKMLINLALVPLCIERGYSFGGLYHYKADVLLANFRLNEANLFLSDELFQKCLKIEGYRGRFSGLSRIQLNDLVSSLKTTYSNVIPSAFYDRLEGRKTELDYERMVIQRIIENLGKTAQSSLLCTRLKTLIDGSDSSNICFRDYYECDKLAIKGPFRRMQPSLDALSVS